MKHPRSRLPGAAAAKKSAKAKVKPDPHERMSWVLLVHFVLCRDGSTTEAELRKELKLSGRILAGACILLKEWFNAPLVFDAQTGRVTYEIPFHLPPDLALSLRALRPLFMLRQILGPANTKNPDEQAEQAALDMLAEALGGLMSYQVGSLDRLFFPASSLEGEGRRRHAIGLLHAAVRTRSEVQFTYETPLLYDGPIDAPPHVMHPLRLFEREQTWVLLAYDTETRTLATYVVDGLRSLKQTGQKFTPVVGLDIAGFLSAREARIAKSTVQMDSLPQPNGAPPLSDEEKRRRRQRLGEN